MIYLGLFDIHSTESDFIQGYRWDNNNFDGDARLIKLLQDTLIDRLEGVFDTKVIAVDININELRKEIIDRHDCYEIVVHSSCDNGSIENVDYFTLEEITVEE